MSSPPPGPLVAPAGLVAWLAMLDSLGERHGSSKPTRWWLPA